MTRLLAIAITLCLAVPVTAQTRAETFPVAGTVVRVSPALVPREDSRTSGQSVVLVQTGTTVQVTGRQGPWYTVIFPTPQGDLPGLMEPDDIRIDPESALPDARGSGKASARGVVDIRGFGFPQSTPGGSARRFADVLVRHDVTIRPARAFQLAAGVDLRASSQDDIAEDWQIDIEDRGVLRPRVALRRLSAALSTRHFSLDVGKQFIRWGRADIISPVDRFAPRDYLNVLDSEFLPVIGARAAVRAAGETFEVVWVPQLTPSRLPLVGGRWAPAPAGADGLALEDNGAIFPARALQGARWSHSGRFDLGISAFDGFQHLPDITADADPERGVVRLTRTYARLRSFGAELAVPTALVTVRTEAAYALSPDTTGDDYVLYVVEAERQAGEWLLTAGYAGEVVTEERSDGYFQAERGMAGSIIGRAAVTIDPRRSFEIEGATRHDGGGLYVKGSYSQSFGGHWRLTIAAAGIGGDDDDFFGQYARNSHVSAALRLSY